MAEIDPEELMKLDTTPMPELVKRGILPSEDVPSMFHELRFSKADDGTITGEWVMANAKAAGEVLTQHILSVKSLASQLTKEQQKAAGTLTGEELKKYEAFVKWKDECIALYKSGVYEWPEFGG